MLLFTLFFFIFEGRSSQLESWFLSISYWCFVILCDAISFGHTIGIFLRTYSLFFVTFSRVRTIYFHFFILFYILIYILHYFVLSAAKFSKEKCLITSSCFNFFPWVVGFLLSPTLWYSLFFHHYVLFDL